MQREDFFRFVINRSIELTINNAERVIRPAITYYKVPSGARSLKGADYFTGIYSIMESYWK